MVVLLVLVVTTLTYTIWSRRDRRRAAEPGGEAVVSKPSFRMNWETLLVFGFLVFFLVAIRIGWEWPFIAKLMPIYIAAIPGALLVLVQLFRVSTGRERSAADDSLATGLSRR